MEHDAEATGEYSFKDNNLNIIIEDNIIEIKDFKLEENDNLYTGTISKLEINNNDSVVANMLSSYSEGESLGFYEQ